MGIEAILAGAGSSTPVSAPLLATVDGLLFRDVNNQNTVSIVIDGADTDCTCIVPFDYTATIGDRLLVQRVGTLMYALSVLVAATSGPAVVVASNPSSIALTTTVEQAGFSITAPPWPANAVIIHVMDCLTNTTGAGTTVGNIHVNAGANLSPSNIHLNANVDRETNVQVHNIVTAPGDTITSSYHQTSTGASTVESTHTRLIGLFFPL